jgi:hypothetical protein
LEISKKRKEDSILKYTCHNLIDRRMLERMIRKYDLLHSKELAHKRESYCDMTPESRNSGARADVHC